MKAAGGWLDEVSRAFETDRASETGPVALRHLAARLFREAEDAATEALRAIQKHLSKDFAESADDETESASDETEDELAHRRQQALAWARVEVELMLDENERSARTEDPFEGCEELVSLALDNKDTLTAITTSLRKNAHDDESKLRAVWGVCVALDALGDLPPPNRLRTSLAALRLVRSLDHLEEEADLAFDVPRDRLVEHVATSLAVQEQSFPADTRRDLVKQVSDHRSNMALTRLPQPAREQLLDLFDKDDKIAEEEVDWAKITLAADFLPDEEFLAACKRRGLATHAVERHLERGNVDAARAAALEFIETAELADTIPINLGEILLEAGHRDAGLDVLAAFERRGPVADVSTMLAELLLESGRDAEAAEVLMRRFQQRPALPTYQAVMKLRPTLREGLLGMLKERRLFRVAIDIALEEGDQQLLREVSGLAEEGDALHLWQCGGELLHKLGLATAVAQRVLPYARRQGLEIQELEQLEQLVPASQRTTPLKSTPPEPGVDVGTKVHHKKFGAGVIVTIQDGGPDAIAEIDFDGDTKKLRLSFVTIIDD